MKVNGVSLLSSKNPKTNCPAWSISRKSCVNACGEVCADCYAGKGCYVFPVVKNALEKRYNWFARTPDNIVVGTMVKALGRRHSNFIRIFESGDFSSVRDIRLWRKIAIRLPNKKFWFPTKGHTNKEFLPELRKLNKLPNVQVKPSSTNFDRAAPRINGLSGGATSYKDKAPKNHVDCPGECEGCRACWTEARIAYHYH